MKRKYWEREKLEGEVENKNKKERREKIMGEKGRVGSKRREGGRGEIRENNRGKKTAII